MAEQTISPQNYANHRHNPKISGFASLFFVIAVVAFALRGFAIGGRYTMAIGLAGLLSSLLMLIAISRLYTTKLQDRIIKLEMKVRGMTVLTPAQQAVLARLSKPQVVALRFASDDELPALLERADRENLSSDEIKKAITNWVPDGDRT